MNAPAPRRIWRAPALRALLAQLLAFPLTLAAVWLLARAGILPAADDGTGAGAWLAVALVQGAWAALLSWRLGLATWWRAIALLFPACVLLARLAAETLALPPAAFLAVFVLLLLVYWSTFRTQVPYYPSGQAAWDTVAEQLPDRPLRIIDIGSGLGGLVLDLARRRPDCGVSGIELAPLPWLASSLRARLTGSRARFMRGDYENLNFGHYDVVFAYLSPAAMSALWRKASGEMRPGSMLLSYEFAIAERAPDRSFVTTDRKKILHLWHF
ncbi:class I SAM-dependent methyltransferase [Massilia sp. YIM B02763]|uniref:class I SAM-dependent methyltransferase n=1 Tax=Massilia sp. YIM B02763 TaxID=3050130 RepID=UPI0025B6B72C|nr:class I SAM-dependent methyltransferase [Massilia sp. YIM B02763]MDN4052131.1 class I SAM-dependent methyltransferase [Massilia sp. YIM B02763]